MTAEPRRARVGVSVVFAACGAAFATWAARVPAVQADLGLGPGGLAVGLFGLAAGSVVTLLAAGPLITMIGSRAGALVGATILCVGLPLVAFAPNLEGFVAALVVLGIGNSLLDVSMNAHAARVEQAYGRPIFASFHAFWNIGGLVGSGAAAVLAAQRVPVAAHFPVAGAVLLLVALAATTRGFLAGPDQGQGESPFALPGRGLIPVGVIVFCGFLAEGTVNDWSAVYLTTVTDASHAVASLGFFAFSIAMIAVRLVADRLSGRIGIVVVMRGATLVALLGFGLVIAVPVAGVGVLGFGVVGLGLAAIVPLAWSSAARKQPDNPGRAVSAIATCGYLGFLVGPVLVGPLAAAFGYRLALACAGALVVAVLFLAPALDDAAAGRRR
ncbi:MFS transporter [Pseudonocardia xinjiangensis]|uniref:MFS transporter n=1 Tax=Pseudonocardia xinjiangensis TaxID=75289 RepID=A0ABX1RCP1_9PSEU|nr:MFS transporter [Pseudonocardia xinjiangensis]NMH78147.1 MFS transporter [Pseudonocardia xinjiangensis]